jgi:hypothetical protein
VIAPRLWHLQINPLEVRALLFRQKIKNYFALSHFAFLIAACPGYQNVIEKLNRLRFPTSPNEDRL